MSFGEQERERRSRAGEERKIAEHWLAFQRKGTTHKSRQRVQPAKGRTVRILERQCNIEKYSPYNMEKYNRSYSTDFGEVVQQRKVCISRQVGTKIEAHLLLEILHNKPILCGTCF
jgi:hypothetical protein